MKLRHFILAIVAIVVFTVSTAFATPPGTGNGVQHQFTFTPTNQPYFNAPGHAIVGATAKPNFDVQNDFASGVRSDIFGQSGMGHYDNMLQSGFYSYLANSVVAGRGNALNYWGYSEGLGKGNAIFGASNITCYGGGEVWDGTGSTPECGALGEYAAIQGTLVWTAAVTGSPAANATTIQYTSSANDAILGERYLLNLNHTYTTGTFQSVSGFDITFSGTSFVSALASGTWYLKVGSTSEYYTGACSGDDVKTDGTHCIGHWYRVLSVTDNTHLHMAGVFDNVHLTSTPGSSIMLVQGTEIQGFDKTAHTLTIPTNTFSWSNADVLISPPTSFQFFDGLNLIFEKQFKTGVPSTPNAAIELDSVGPAAMDRAIHVGRPGNPGDPGGYYTGIYFDAPIQRAAIEIASTTPYGILMKTATTRFNNALTLGTSGEGSINYVNVATSPAYNPAIKVDGVPLNVAVGLSGDAGGVKHQSTAVGCTTAASVGATCTSAALSWDGAPFADTSYRLVCTLYAPIGVPVISSVARSTGSFTVTIVAMTASAATASVDCIGVHG